MDIEKRLFVRNVMFNDLCGVFEMEDASRIVDEILDDVCEDIEETADEYFNSSDIRLALQRVLLDKILN